MALTPFFSRSSLNAGNSSMFDPWLPISRFWDAMDFPAIGVPVLSFSKDVQAVANTRVDWKETPQAHIFTADLPGLKEEEVKVELVDEGTLVISGERQKEEVKESDRWHRMERSSGRFMRRFRLPDNVNVDGIAAKMENGVLSVSVPKLKPDAASNGDVKTVDISS